MLLRELIATDIYKLILLFARLGTALMLMPGFSSNIVYARVRLVLGLGLSFLLLPSLASHLPAMPPNPLMLFMYLAGEVTTGVFLGLMTLILLAPLDFAGNSIGFAVGLTNMFTFDPITEQQSQLVTGFLNLTAITLVFVSDSHHLMLRALADSYNLFTPGEPLLTADLSEHLVRSIGSACLMGVRLAAPLIVFTLTFNTALGLMNRLVPQIPVFFVGLPIQILGGLVILSISLPIIMNWLLIYLGDGLSLFLSTE